MEIIANQASAASRMTFPECFFITVWKYRCLKQLYMTKTVENVDFSQYINDILWWQD